MKRLSWIRPSFFAWIVVPVAIYGAYTTYGEPHVIWSYDWRDDGRSYGDIASRWYVRCTYIGRGGAITEYPTNGKCGWVRFAKVAGS